MNFLGSISDIVTEKKHGSGYDSVKMTPEMIRKGRSTVNARHEHLGRLFTYGKSFCKCFSFTLKPLFTGQGFRRNRRW